MPSSTYRLVFASLKGNMFYLDFCRNHGIRRYNAMPKTILRGGHPVVAVQVEETKPTTISNYYRNASHIIFYIRTGKDCTTGLPIYKRLGQLNEDGTFIVEMTSLSEYKTRRFWRQCFGLHLNMIRNSCGQLYKAKAERENLSITVNKNGSSPIISKINNDSTITDLRLEQGKPPAEVYDASCKKIEAKMRRILKWFVIREKLGVNFDIGPRTSHTKLKLVEVLNEIKAVKEGNYDDLVKFHSTISYYASFRHTYAWFLRNKKQLYFNAGLLKYV